MGVGGDNVHANDRRRFMRNAALAVLAGTRLAGASARRAHVIVAGGGFAGATCALQLRQLEPAIDVTLVDPEDHYVTCPMSDAALVGWRSMQSLTVSRAGLARAGVRCVRDRVVSIDAQSRRVRLASSKNLACDRLVVAPGIRFLWDRLEGYGEAQSQRMPHAWRAGPQTDLLAAQLRAIDDGAVFAICVPPGLMRCPPAPFERASVVAAWLKQHKPHSKVLIFDANNRFPRQESFTAAWKQLYGDRIEWIPVTEGGAVERVDVRASTLYTSSGAHRVAVANVIPPQAPGAFALDAALASGHGWCPVDPMTFESTLVPHVHVIGDACIADAMPKAASSALSQAQQCAAAIVAHFADRVPPTPAFDSVCYSALAQDRSLAIHARFRVDGGHIVAESAPSEPAPAISAAERDAAIAWYRSIRHSAFGA